MGRLCPALRAKTEVRVAQGQRAKLKPEAGARKHCAKIPTRVEHVIDTGESASHILAISHQTVQELEPKMHPVCRLLEESDQV